MYGVDLIDAYKSYFNASYENLKRRIMDTLKEVQEKFGEDKWVEVRETLRHNADAEVIWSDRSDLSFPSVPAEDDLQFIWQTLRNEAVSILTDKAATPLSVMAVPASLRKAYARYEEVRIMIEAYNKSVSKVNLKSMKPFDKGFLLLIHSGHPLRPLIYLLYVKKFSACRLKRGGYNQILQIIASVIMTFRNESVGSKALNPRNEMNSSSIQRASSADTKILSTSF